MVEPLVGNGNRLPVRIEQADFTGAGDDLPDTPEGKVELGGEGSDLGALFGCGRKDKLVVITTGQLALARQLRIGAGAGDGEQATIVLTRVAGDGVVLVVDPA